MKRIVIDPKNPVATIVGVGTPPSEDDRAVELSPETHTDLLRAVRHVVEEVSDGLSLISVSILGREIEEKED